MDIIWFLKYKNTINIYGWNIWSKDSKYFKSKQNGNGFLHAFYNI